MSDYQHEETASWDTEQVRRAAPHSPAQRHPTSGQSAPRRPRKRRRSLMNPLVYIAFVLVTSAILAGIGWLLASDLCAFNKEYSTATVEVTAEDSVGSVAAKLHDAGLIKYKWFFKLFGSFAHAKEKIGIGVYTLSTDMDYRALIVNMHNSSGNLNAETVTVTIPEGYTVAQTIRLLAEKGVNTEENLLEAAKTANFDYAFIDNDSEDVSRLEGYLFPDTYEFYKPERAASALGRLLGEFDRRLDAELLEKAEARGYSMKELVTIASLIEKETDGADHAKIASVIYNRLENVGETYHLLQIDAALLYAIPDHTGAITNDDKKVDSPYNLYKHEGLPPTPIANPGEKSLEAAMAPDTTDYYFYALGTDGHHKFSATLAEHNAFVGSAAYGG